MALVLCEHVGAEESPDLLRVIKMALIHDLVEIDAGDTYCYDEKANAGKRERELAAADRLFGILPPDQAREFRELWEEFEEQRTPEARFAAALDRLQPLTLNYIAGGKSWREHGISYSQVIKRNSSIGESSPALWKFTLEMIREAVRKGYIKENG